MIQGIHISSSEMVIKKHDVKKNILPHFIKNQIIAAKVLELLPHGNAKLLVNGKQVIATTSMLLTPGEEVQLKVLQEKDAVILKLLEPVQKMTTRQISSLVSFFSKNKSIPDIFSSKISGVKELISAMALKSEKPDKEFLPKLIEKSGIVWEKKVAGVLLGNKPAISSKSTIGDKSIGDIKSDLDMLLKQDIKGNILKEVLMDDPQKTSALKTAVSFVETIENFQLLNHNSSESGRFVLPFPVFNESEFSFGQLLIDTGEKNEKEKKDADKLIKISFLLNMTRLGPLRADFSILRKEITGRFLLQDEDTVGYVKSMIPELKEKLADIEYTVRDIECSLGKKEEIIETGFIETLVKASEDQMLNIVI